MFIWINITGSLPIGSEKDETKPNEETRNSPKRAQDAEPAMRHKRTHETHKIYDTIEMCQRKRTKRTKRPDQRNGENRNGRNSTRTHETQPAPERFETKWNGCSLILFCLSSVCYHLYLFIGGLRTVVCGLRAGKRSTKVADYAANVICFVSSRPGPTPPFPQTPHEKRINCNSGK